MHASTIRRARALRAATLALAGAALAPLASHPLGAQGAPTSPPPAAPLKPTQLPPLQETVLANGVRLVLVEDHRLPLVSATISFKGGSVYDPAGKDGLSFLTAALLTKGAGTRSADEIAAAIEGVGGSLNAGSGSDFLSVNVDAMTGDAPLAFSLLGDAVAHPTFPQKELDLARTQTLSGLQLQLSQPGALADRAFRKALYGAHPYGRSSSPQTVQAITRDDVLKFASDRIRPQGALLVVAGDLTLARARQLATDAFKGWTGAPAASPALPAVTAPAKNEILLVNRPGSVQASILVGRPTFGPADPRFYALTVANRVLGGGGSARLFDILREKHGWTYGASSGFSRPAGIGAFTASTEARNAVADSALAEMLVQLKRIASEPLTPAELTTAKNALTGSFPLSMQTAGQVAGLIATQKLLGLPADYVSTYRTRIAAVTPAAVKTATAAVARSDASVIVVVGDAEQLYDRLTKIAPVRVVDVQGQPVDMKALAAAKSATVSFNLGALRAGTDSFVVMVQGNAFGYDKETFATTAEGIRITRETKLGPVASTQSDALLSSKGEMRSAKQTGQVQGMPVTMDVSYAGGRVKGSANFPTPQGPKAVTVDTVVPAGVVDESALTGLLPALAWTPAAKFSLPLFSVRANAVRQLSLAVSGTESVTVPAGTFQAFKVDITGGEQPMTVWITADAAHRVVKMAPVGQPVEFVLAK